MGNVCSVVWAVEAHNYRWRWRFLLTETFSFCSDSDRIISDDEILS
jgi:hypothetical protein